MDYVAWCDDLFNTLADCAEANGNDRYANLQNLPPVLLSKYKVQDDFSAEIAVIHAIQDVFRAFSSISSTQTTLHMSYDDLEMLRDPYARWKAAMVQPLTEIEMTVLGVLEEMSTPQLNENVFSTREIAIKALIENPNMSYRGSPVPQDRAEEVLQRLDEYQLVKSHRTISSAQYAIRYCGAARVTRSEVLEDERIDALRTQGEGDTLDYKRVMRLKSPTEKLDFVRDVTAMANAGGEGPRYLLIGVEDSGGFYAPQEHEREDHKKSILGLKETTLQQIVRSHTTHSPSVSIVGKGEHRFGPHALIEITRDVGHLPYRVFTNQEDRTADDAHRRGEIWIRKGSMKSRAEANEVFYLEQIAERHRAIQIEGNDR